MDSCSAAVHDRTDRCPGVLRLHEAADGFLTRVRLPGGVVDARGLAAVARVAAHGNGLVELTSRASLQVRGLPSGFGSEAAALLRAGGLLPSPAHDRVRNVLASPLAGRHPRSLCATDGVVAALDAGLCADPRLAELPGRFLFAVDDGSGLADPGRADVAVVAEGPAVLRLWLGGCPTSLVASPAGSPQLALRAAHAFLHLLCAAWRVADVDDGPGRLARRLGGALVARETAPAADAAPLGALAQPDGRTAMTVLAPLGRLDRDTVDALAALVPEIRLSAARTLTIVDVPAERAAALGVQLSGLGLVGSAASGWRGLSACAGLGACASARVDVRGAAARRARVRGADAPSEHWSACERGCGRPGGVAVAVLARDGGLTIESAGGELRCDDVGDVLARLAVGP